MGTVWNGTCILSSFITVNDNQTVSLHILVNACQPLLVAYARLSLCSDAAMLIHQYPHNNDNIPKTIQSYGMFLDDIVVFEVTRMYWSHEYGGIIDVITKQITHKLRVQYVVADLVRRVMTALTY
jgi:hypothetical protein